MKPHKKWLLIAMAILFGGIPFIIMLAVILYYSPLSAELIREPLQKSMLKHGLNLDWKSGAIQLSEGSCILKDVKLEPVGYTGTPLISHSLEVDFSIKKQENGKRFTLLALRLIEPSRLQISTTQEGFQLSPPLHQFFKKNENSQTLPDVQIRSASIVYGEGKIKQGAFKPIVTIPKIDFRLEQNESQQLVATWQGDFAGLTPSHLSGKILFDTNKKSAWVESNIDRINLPLTLKSGQKIITDIEKFSAQGKLKFNSGLFVFDGSLKANTQRLQLPALELDLTETNPAASGKISFVTSEQKLSWNNLKFNSLQSDFFSSGILNLSNGIDFDGEAQLTRVHPGWSKLIAPGPKGEIARLEIEKGGMIRVDGELRNLTNDGMIVSTGTIILSNLVLHTSYLPHPIKHLNGMLFLKKNRVYCDSLKGKYLNNSLVLKLAGDTTLLQGLSGGMRLDFVGNCDIAQLTRETIRLTMSDPEKIAMLDVQGQLELKGFLETSWPDNPQIKDLRWKYDVDLILQRGRLNHPEFPGPIENIHGDLSVYPDRIQVNNLVGTREGIEVNFGGSLKGPSYFWADSNISASLQCDVRTPDIFDSIEQIKPLKFYQPQGKLAFLIAIKGPMKNLADWKVNSYLEFKNFQFSTPVRWLLKPVSAMNGKLKLDGNALLIEEDFTLQIGGIELNLKGSKISYEHTDLRIAFEGESSLLDEIIPIFMWRFDVEGFAKGNLRIEAIHWQEEDAEASNKVADLEQTLNAIMLDLQSDDIPYELKVTGILEANGGSFRLKQMPSPMKNIHGQLHLNNTTLHFEDASCEWGESKSIVGSGTIHFRTNGVDANFDIQSNYAKLDEWVKKWNPTPQRTSYTLAQTILLPPEWKQTPPAKPKNKKKYSNVYVKVQTDKLDYMQFQGTDYKADIYFNDFNYTNDQLEVKNATGNLYDGKLDFEVDLLLGRNGAPSTITMNFNAIRTNLEKLLSVLQKKNSANKIRGQFTGTLEIKSGLPDFIENLEGKGNIQIQKSNLLFDILGVAMNFIPGINNADLNDFSSDIQLRNKTVEIKNFKGILSMVASLTGKGKIGFDKSMLLNIEVGPHAPVDSQNPLNLINKVLKMFRPLRLKVEGTLEKYSVTPQIPFKEERNKIQDGFEKILKQSSKETTVQ